MVEGIQIENLQFSLKKSPPTTKTKPPHSSSYSIFHMKTPGIDIHGIAFCMHMRGFIYCETYFWSCFTIFSNMSAFLLDKLDQK